MKKQGKGLMDTIEKGIPDYKITSVTVFPTDELSSQKQLPLLQDTDPVLLI